MPLEHGGSVTLWPLREPVIKVVDVGCNPTRIGATPIGLSRSDPWKGGAAHNRVREGSIPSAATAHDEAPRE